MRWSVQAGTGRARRLVADSALPYLAGMAGVALATAALALVLRRVEVPNLSVIYVLLVLWVGSRYGRAPALVTGVLAFGAYDYFLVPPVGTLSVAGPSQVMELVLLLAAALVTGALAGSLERARAAAEAGAESSAQLYDLATAALRLPDVEAALDLLRERALHLAGVASFRVLAIEGGAAEPVGGPAPDRNEARQAVWSFEHRQAIGCVIRDGQLALMGSRPRGAGDLAVLPLTSGAVVARVREDVLGPAETRLLTALVGLAELLLERRRAILESDRRRAAEASDSLKAAILSSLSHELKSPIASMRAGITALADPRSGVTGDQRELLLGLDRQALRLDRLVSDLLTMSRLEAQVATEPAPSSFPEVLGGVLLRLRPGLEGRSLEVGVAPGLPPVLADELQLERVLANLIENAIEWTPPGGVIEVGAQARAEVLVAWVANEGPAIPTADLARIFDKFWTNRPSGSGLGLAICKRIVEAQGGTIEARNLRGGPRFTLTLPLAAPGPAPARGAAP